MRRLTPKRILTVGLTFAVALSTGFVVQYGDAVASRWGADMPVAGPTTRSINNGLEFTPASASIVSPRVLPQPASVEFQNVAISLDQIPVEETAPYIVQVPSRSDVAQAPEMVSGQLDDLVIETVASEPMMSLPEVETADSPVDAETATTSCEIKMEASEVELALVQLDVRAPCHAEQVLAIHHEGLVFNAKTDANGTLSVDVPALANDAYFIASFDGGQGAVAHTVVTNFEQFDRAVLQWHADAGVELHVLEFGASYGEAGHLWAGSPGDLEGVAAGKNGFITRVGDDDVLMPMMAEVYTFPSGTTSLDGSVVLTVEAAVTQMNCNQQISAQTIQLRSNSKPMVESFSIEMPACDAIGEYLVLNNILEDITLASK